MWFAHLELLGSAAAVSAWLAAAWVRPKDSTLTEATSALRDTLVSAGAGSAAALTVTRDRLVLRAALQPAPRRAQSVSRALCISVSTCCSVSEFARGRAFRAALACSNRARSGYELHQPHTSVSQVTATRVLFQNVQVPRSRQTCSSFVEKGMNRSHIKWLVMLAPGKRAARSVKGA